MERERYEGCGIGRYLERIGCAGVREPDIAALTVLQECHVRTVPYENLEIMAGKPLTLDIPSLYEKIVSRGRGGYCFELNGLFCWLLKELGYHVTQHFGRWLRGEPLDYPMRRHRVLRVALDGRDYICDVGVGMAAPRRPLLFEVDAVQQIMDEQYRIVRDEINIYVVQYMSRAGEWKNLYSFNDDPCIDIDYFLPHYYCTTHPDSIFINQTMVYIRTEKGRYSISDVYDQATGEKVRELRHYEPEGLETQLLRTPAQFEAALRDYFGISIN